MNDKNLYDRFLKKNTLGRNAEKLNKMSLFDIMDALDGRESFDVLYFEHPEHLTPSKVYRISVDYKSLNTIDVIDIDKLRKHSMFRDVSVEDLEATIDIDGTYLSKSDVLKMSDEIYIGQLEVIEDNPEDIEDLYDGYITADGDNEVEDILYYLTNDDEIYTRVHYLDDNVLANNNFVFIENLQVKLYLHHSIKFGE